MRRSRAFLARIEIQATLFCIFLFLYIWPLLTSFGQGYPEILYVYFYGVLIFQTFVMILLARCVGKPSSGKDEDLQSEEPKHG